MSVINRTLIDSYYGRIEQQLYVLVPRRQWVFRPKYWRLTKAKTKYGMADNNGVIHINHDFLGSKYFQLLDAVLRHEFAHLCVGLMQGHNGRFKQCEQLFNACFDANVKDQAKEYAKQVSYNFLLKAELIDGQLITIKKTHRRHRNYLNYRISRYRTYYYRQQAIKRFKYIDIT